MAENTHTHTQAPSEAEFIVYASSNEVGDSVAPPNDSEAFGISVHACSSSQSMNMHADHTVAPVAEVVGENKRVIRAFAKKRTARHFNFCLSGGRFKSVRIDAEVPVRGMGASGAPRAEEDDAWGPA